MFFLCFTWHFDGMGPLFVVGGPSRWGRLWLVFCKKQKSKDVGGIKNQKEKTPFLSLNNDLVDDIGGLLDCVMIVGKFLSWLGEDEIVGVSF